MKIRATDSDGDWTFGQGKSCYRVGIDEIVQDIRTALNFFMGEAFWNTKFGVDWWNLIGGKAPQVQQNIILQCRQIIMTRWGVSKIESVEITFTNFRRSLSLQYRISTIFGTTSDTFTKGFNHV